MIIKNKSAVIGVFIICVLLFISPVVSANEFVDVYLDGNLLSFDVKPQVIDGRTMVPMRKIFESLGAVVTWDDDTQTVTGRKGDTVVNVSIDSRTLFKNGVPKLLDVAPMLIESRTLVPVRAIAESFDCEVNWIEETNTVEIVTDGEFVSEKVVLSAAEIAERVSSSVFYIEVYDTQKQIFGSGSGFFINTDGIAVTNYHVIENSSSAQITTINGEKYDVTSVIAFDEKMDVAIIKVSKTSVSGATVSGFSATTVGNSDNIKAGQIVYALGSPVGLQNTISNGIISNVKQVVGEDTYIQITAPISHGSSGGALVNEYGEVLGITSAGIDDAQNIGFAIPINVIKMFDLNSRGTPYSNFVASNKKFTLELNTKIIDVEVGKTVEVMVYAKGKGDDWSIYWEADDRRVISCEWGDWQENDSSVCSLKITGKKEGVAVVTVYSDVDFAGKSVVVNVKAPKGEYYSSSIVKVPTYTSITGVSLKEKTAYENNDLYVYSYDNINVVQNYVDCLFELGFVYYDETKDVNSTIYYYLSPNNNMIALTLSSKFREVGLLIPR